MRVVRDVRCVEGHIEYNTLSDPEREYKCVTCGMPTTTHFASLAEGVVERRADNFSPVVFGGVRYDSRDSWESFRKEWKSQHNQELNVTGDSPRARRAMLEEANQSAREHFQRRGNDRGVRDLERAGARIR